MRAMSTADTLTSLALIAVAVFALVAAWAGRREYPTAMTRWQRAMTALRHVTRTRHAPPERPGGAPSDVAQPEEDPIGLHGPR
jgi:sucrose-6-phosphate hydrolase SacC (GH32 family)